MTSGNVQVTIDCADPAALAVFWAAVLGYAPPDIDGIHAALRALGHRVEDLGNWYRIEDPAGQGPRLAFQRVPEAKTVKNAFILTSLRWATGRMLVRSRLRGWWILEPLRSGR